MDRSRPESPQGRLARLAQLLPVGLWLALAGGPADATYSIQTGAFANPDNSAREVRRLEAAGVPVATRGMTTASGQSLTRVLAGPFDSREAAEAALAGLADTTATAPRAAQTTGAPKPPPESGAAAASTRRWTGSPTLGTSDAARAARNHVEPTRGLDHAGPSAAVTGQEPEPQTARLSGFLQTEAGYVYSGDAHWQKLRGVAEVGLDGRWNDSVKWKVSGRGYYDLVFDVTNYYPDDVRDNRMKELMFHETYIDIAADKWDFRVGRQNIVWGEMVGIFVADVVSAKDLREFILRDFDWIRIPQWATRAEYFGDNFHAEAVWIPYMSYDEIGEPGDDYFPNPLPPPQGHRAIFANDDRPSNTLDHSAGGLRLSWLYDGWDTSAFYYTSMNSAPAFARQIVIEPQPAVVYTPVHDRIHQGGLTVSKDFGLGVFRGEAVYTRDALLETTSPTAADGLVKLDYLDYALGVEFVTENESRLNLQFYQRWFTDHDPNIVPDEVESGVSIYASTKALHPDVEPELLFMHSLNRSDWLLRAKVSWRFMPDWRLAGGIDILQGPVNGLIGQYDDADRVYLELRYSF